MTLAELFGILTATAGLYLALSMPDGDQSLKIGRLRLTTGVSAGVFAVTGLLVLLASYTRPASWWGESSSAIESAIFWVAAAVSLAGAFGLIRAETNRGVKQSGVALAIGGTCLFGAVGDVIAASACLLVVGGLGWKLQTEAVRLTSPESEETSTGSSDRFETASKEPLLVTVAVMLLVWLLGSGIYAAVTIEVRPSTHSQNPRALPRPLRRDPGEETENATLASTGSNDESTWLAIATGLLVTTAGLGLLRNNEPETPNPIPDEPAEAPS